MMDFLMGLAILGAIPLGMAPLFVLEALCGDKW